LKNENDKEDDKKVEALFESDKNNVYNEDDREVLNSSSNDINDKKISEIKTKKNSLQCFYNLRTSTELCKKTKIKGKKST
jgi:hypothetical protein